MESIDQAFNALKSYHAGSGRAALLPIDEAARAAATNPAARARLEQRLMPILQEAESDFAREYALSQLALIGTDKCVGSLAKLLSHPVLSTAARSALQAIGTSPAASSIRSALPRLSGKEKVGAINSLAQLRDDQSVSALRGLLDDPDTNVRQAVAIALGKIASPKAASILAELHKKSAPELQSTLGDAILICADRNLEKGRATEARRLYALLKDSAYPKHVVAAAERGLRAA